MPVFGPVRECAVCFCAALCLLGVSEEQMLFLVPRCVCFWWRGSGSLHHRAWKLQWFLARATIKSILSARSRAGNEITVGRYLQTAIQPKDIDSKVYFKYYVLHLKWKIVDDSMVHLKLKKFLFIALNVCCSLIISLSKMKETKQKLSVELWSKLVSKCHAWPSRQYA